MQSKSSYVAMLLFVSAILVFGYAFLHHAPTKSRAAATPAPPPAAAHSFPPGTDVYYRLEPKSQSQILQLVRHFCKTDYHTQSCIAYVTKCGRPCLADLSGAEIGRVLAGYKQIRKAHGLPPLLEGL